MKYRKLHHITTTICRLFTTYQQSHIHTYIQRRLQGVTSKRTSNLKIDVVNLIVAMLTFSLVRWHIFIRTYLLTIVKEDVRKNATANEKLICVQIYDVMPVYRPQASFIPRFGFKSVR